MEQKLTYKINLYSLVSLLFVLPLDRRLAPPLIGVFLITSFINGSFKVKEKALKILLPGTIYLLYVFGLFYSTNQKPALFDLEQKLSLTLIPLAFFTTKLQLRQHRVLLQKTFTFGLLTASLLCLILGVFNFFQTKDLASFFYANLSYFLHPSYFSVMLNLGICILYFQLLNAKNHFTKFNIFLISFFSIIIIALAGKTGIITAILVHLFFLSKIASKYKIWKKIILVLALSTVGITTIILSSPVLKNRIIEVSSTITGENKNKQSSTAIRPTIWQCCLEIIYENPLGVGSGDIKEELIKKYQNKGLTKAVNQKLNTHNQFLQLGVGFGWIGIIVLLIIIGVPLIDSFKKSNYLFICFLILIVINFLTESMLERQTGVVFFSLFYTLFHTNFSKE